MPRFGVVAAAQHDESIDQKFRPLFEKLLTPTVRYRWRDLNLVRNPFGEMTRSERIALAVVDEPLGNGFGHLPWPFPRRHHAVQWIGHCGAGKTTRLLHFASTIPESYYVYVTPERTCDAFPTADVLIIDEADRMPGRLWHRVLDTGSALILGTHRCLARSLVGHRYRQYRYDVPDHNTPEHLCRVVNRRIEYCCLDASEPMPVLLLPDAIQLVAKFGSDFRSIEAYLYQRVQSAEKTGGDFHFID